MQILFTEVRENLQLTSIIIQNKSQLQNSYRAEKTNIGLVFLPQSRNNSSFLLSMSTACESSNDDYMNVYIYTINQLTILFVPILQ